jgi:hypothetical protein
MKISLEFGKKKEKEKKNADSHIFLYAKYHYKRGNVISDMQHIIGERCALEPEHVDVESIISVLTEVTYPYIKTENQMFEFLKDCFRRASTKCFYVNHETKFGAEEIINSMLVILGNQKVYDKEGHELIELDEPDYDLLPKPERS